ncbi:MAG: hypothetical protein ABL920_08825 [Methylotenera sp.]
MPQSDRNACMNAFEVLRAEEYKNNGLDITADQYWLFERGYRAAVQDLIIIAETGTQPEKFVSPKLQSLADRLISATDCV